MRPDQNRTGSIVTLGGSGHPWLGVFVGFIAFVVLGWMLPVVGHLIGGLVTGLIARGIGRGGIAGFLAGIFGGTTSPY